MINHSLPDSTVNDLLLAVQQAYKGFNQIYQQQRLARQPVHTVYGGAQIWSAQTKDKISQVALKTLETYAPNASALAQILVDQGSYDQKIWEKVYQRVRDKLKKEAVEDFRIDFEDGYGTRPDDEEDHHAAAAAQETVRAMEHNSLPPFIGIRVKSLSQECAPRALRTLDIFISTLLQQSGKGLPQNFVVTLPKVTMAEQAKVLSQALAAIEKQHRLAVNTVKMEIMIETPQAIINGQGYCPLQQFVTVTDGRVIAAHFGTYDYTAGCEITAAYQTMDHGVCDFAKHVMKVAFAQTGIMLSDGATNIMPVGPHKIPRTEQEKRENLEVVERAWRLSYRHIRHSLSHGFYQGWDLHPGQLPVRYATVYSFFLETLAMAQDRLKAFIDKAAQATLLGDVFDDAATGQGLLNYFIRALNCGAITEQEVMATGLSLAAIETRSFNKILENLKK